MQKTWRCICKSGGEGRNLKQVKIKELFENGQVAKDMWIYRKSTMERRVQSNGSYAAIGKITSLDGRNIRKNGIRREKEDSCIYKCFQKNRICKFLNLV